MVLISFWDRMAAAENTAVFLREYYTVFLGFLQEKSVVFLPISKKNRSTRSKMPSPHSRMPIFMAKFDYYSLHFSQPL